MKFTWGHSSVHSKCDLPGNSETEEVIDIKVVSMSCLVSCIQFILSFNKHLLSCLMPDVFAVPGAPAMAADKSEQVPMLLDWRVGSGGKYT